MVDDTLYSSGIYAITSLACGRIYVGSSLKIGRRWIEHRAELRRGRHRTLKLQEAWLLYGEDNFSFSVLEIVPDPNMLLDREQHWLDFLEAVDYGFNMFYMVDRPDWTPERRAKLSATKMGHSVSPEVRERLRQANLGKKTHTEESKAKLRAFNIGKKMSPDAIARTAAAWTGRKHSPETRQKISEARKAMYANGYQHPMLGRKASPETIAKRLGRKHTPETKLKISQARKAHAASQS